MASGYRWFLEIAPQCWLVDASGKRWDFEVYSYAGPIVLDKEGGDPIDTPHERSPFWHAFAVWQSQRKDTQ